MNDVAIQSLLKGDEPNAAATNNETALENLKRGEQILEQITAEGKDVDRNLIVVILYNLACTYQRLQMLEDCASYLDGTIYNLEAKVTSFDDNQDVIQQMLVQQAEDESDSGERSKQLQSVIETTKKFNISSKLFKLRYLCKCHLQLCAVLSQLNKHQEALYHGQMASFFCQQLIKNTLTLCKSYIARLMQEKSQAPESRGLIDQELVLLRDEEEAKDDIGKRTSYYAEENEKLLNLLITNCEPILSEISGLIDHFNSYNGIQRVIDKSQLFSQPNAYSQGGTMGTLDDISIASDCQVLDHLQMPPSHH